MSELDKLIEELCPDGVEYKKLSEVLENNNAPKSISKKHYKDNGIIPIIDQSQSYVAGYTDDESATPPVLPCIVFGDHTRVVKYADKTFAQGASGTRVFMPKYPHLNTKYIYYVFSNLDIPSRGYNRHWSIVKDILIPLPPLSVQEEIVRILDNFTELTAELTARKKQYEYYRDELLTFGDEVKWKTLGEVASSTLSYGSGASATEFDNQVRYIRITDITENGILTNSKVSPNIFDSKYLLNEGDILFARSGATVGKTYKYSANDGKAIYAGYLIRVVANKNIVLPDFLYYCVNTRRYWDFVNNSKSIASQPNINARQYGNFKIPIPPLDQQERIVSILDKFDALVNDISIGLPAEIEAREKQYEYYREKLLSFKELDRKEA